MANKRHWSSVTTLKGMPIETQKQFSWENLRHYFRVKLWDKSKLCAYCTKPILHIKDASLDHIVPRYHGGHLRLSNLQLMHRKCNGAKSNTLSNGFNQKATVPLKRFTPKTPSTSFH